MYRLVRGIKTLKKPLMAINKFHFNEIHARVSKAMQDLQHIQQKMHALFEQEKAALTHYHLMVNAERSFLQQKAKVNWLHQGDQNTVLFWLLKHRRRTTGAKTLIDKNGVLQTNYKELGNTLVDYFSFLGMKKKGTGPSFEIILQEPTLCNWRRDAISIPFSNEEIKAAMSVANDNARVPDGYNSYFSKKTWSIIGPTVCAAIKDFFETGQLLRQVNTTVLAMMPKVINPTHPFYLRSIACCNTSASQN